MKTVYRWTESGAEVLIVRWDGWSEEVIGWSLADTIGAAHAEANRDLRRGRAHYISMYRSDPWRYKPIPGRR